MQEESGAVAGSATHPHLALQCFGIGLASGETKAGAGDSVAAGEGPALEALEEKALFVERDARALVRYGEDVTVPGVASDGENDGRASAEF